MKRKVEASLQDKFIKLLKAEGILYLKTDGGLKYYPAEKVIKNNDFTYSGKFRPVKSPEGFADIIVFNECAIFIEVKTDIGKLRSSQIKKFKELRELNYLCYVLRPRNWEAAKARGKLTSDNVFREMDWE